MSETHSRPPNHAPIPASQWTEDDGDVLWWCWKDGAWLGEPPYVGSPLDMGYTVELHARDELARITALRDDMTRRYAGMMESVKGACDSLQSSLRSLEKLRQEVAALKPRAGRR